MIDRGDTARTGKSMLAALVWRPVRRTAFLSAAIVAVAAGLCMSGAAAVAWAAADADRDRSHAQVVFSGNKALSSSRLRSLLAASGCWNADSARMEAGASGNCRESGTATGPLRAMSPSAEAGVREAVLNGYREQGYLSASVDSIVFTPGSATGEMSVYVSEGEPAVVGSVRFVGNKAVSTERLLRACGISAGTGLNQDIIASACGDILSCLAAEGMPFATVRAGEFEINRNEVSLAFVIDEGPVCRVRELKLENSRALSPKALARALRMKHGDTYSEAELQRGLTQLRRTGLFDEVGEPVVSRSEASAQSPGDGVTISIPVRDKKTTSIGGAVGFRGRSNELTGALSLSVMNLARSGRSARASWESMGGNTSSLRFLYAEPWVSGLPFSSTVSFEHMARDTFFAKTSLAVSLKIPVSRSLSWQVGTSFEKAINTDGPHSRATRMAWLAGAELFLGEPAWLSRNSFLVSFELSRGNRKTVYLSPYAGSPNESRSFSTLRSSLLLQGRTWGSQICVLDASACAILEGKELVGGDELFPLGGKNTLRGYSERQFLAATVASVQLEYGLVAGNDGGRAFVFLDSGYASTPALSARDRLHFGYGVGLRVPSPLGLAGIDFGIPAGEAFSSGKIHVGLEGTF